MISPPSILTPSPGLVSRHEVSFFLIRFIDVFIVDTRPLSRGHHQITSLYVLRFACIPSIITVRRPPPPPHSLRLLSHPLPPPLLPPSPSPLCPGRSSLGWSRVVALPSNTGVRIASFFIHTVQQERIANIIFKQTHAIETCKQTGRREGRFVDCFEFMCSVSVYVSVRLFSVLS